MKKYDNNLRGAIFANGYKRPGTKMPDVTGIVEIDGVTYKIAGWNNTSPKGVEYTSIKLTPKDAENYEAPRDAGDLPQGVEGAA